MRWAMWKKLNYIFKQIAIVCVCWILANLNSRYTCNWYINWWMLDSPYAQYIEIIYAKASTEKEKKRKQAVSQSTANFLRIHRKWKFRTKIIRNMIDNFLLLKYWQILIFDAGLSFTFDFVQTKQLDRFNPKFSQFQVLRVNTSVHVSHWSGMTRIVLFIRPENV